MATKTARADFEEIFPSLVQDLLGEGRKFNLPANALEWFEKVGDEAVSCAHLSANTSPVTQRKYPWRETEQRHIGTRFRLTTPRTAFVLRRIQEPCNPRLADGAFASLLPSQ